MTHEESLKDKKGTEGDDGKGGGVVARWMCERSDGWGA